jgi:hypothetical protein
MSDSFKLSSPLELVHNDRIHAAKDTPYSKRIEDVLLPSNVSGSFYGRYESEKHILPSPQKIKLSYAPGTPMKPQTDWFPESASKGVEEVRTFESERRTFPA